MDDLIAMQAALHAYQDLAECLVKTIRWTEFHTTVAITFDYLWLPDGTVRPDVSNRRHVTLVFRFVREFRLKNDLRPIHVEEPEQIGWGMNEVSNVTVRREEVSTGFGEFGVEFYRARLNFEQASWIEIVFAQLDVVASDEPG